MKYVPPRSFALYVQSIKLKQQNGVLSYERKVENVLMIIGLH